MSGMMCGCFAVNMSAAMPCFLGTTRSDVAGVLSVEVLVAGRDNHGGIAQCEEQNACRKEPPCTFSGYFSGNRHCEVQGGTGPLESPRLEHGDRYAQIQVNGSYGAEWKEISTSTGGVAGVIW